MITIQSSKGKDWEDRIIEHLTKSDLQIVIINKTRIVNKERLIHFVKVEGYGK